MDCFHSFFPLTDWSKGCFINCIEVRGNEINRRTVRKVRYPDSCISITAKSLGKTLFLMVDLIHDSISFYSSDATLGFYLRLHLWSEFRKKGLGLSTWRWFSALGHCGKMLCHQSKLLIFEGATSAVCLHSSICTANDCLALEQGGNDLPRTLWGSRLLERKSFWRNFCFCTCWHDGRR